MRDDGLTVTVLERLLDLAVSQAGSTASSFACLFATNASDEDMLSRVAGAADRVGSRDEEEEEDTVEA